MRNCFIPYCDAQCKHIPKRAMFLAPKNPKIFAIWKSLMPQVKREFKQNDKLCERHFEKDDIISTWEHNINGKICVLERSKPKLKDNAIPMLHLEVPLAFMEKKKRWAKSKAIELEQEIVGTIEEVPEAVTIEYEEVQHEEEVNETVTPSVEEKFDALYEDLFEVILPTTLWGVHRDPQRKFISFSQFSLEKMGLDKLYIIHNDLKTEIYLDGELVAREVLQSTDPEIISTIIEGLNNKA